MLTTKVYTADGNTKVFQSDRTGKVNSSFYLAVFLGDASPTATPVALDDYTLVNNAVVFRVIPSSGTTVTIQTATEDEAALQSPYAVSTCAAHITSINNAAGNATTATTQAGIATTKAGEASQSVIDASTFASAALNYAGEASQSATNATSFASAASGFATNAKGYRDELTTLTTATETVAVDGSSTSSYDSSTGVLSLGIPTGATGPMRGVGSVTVSTVSSGGTPTATATANGVNTDYTFGLVTGAASTIAGTAATIAVGTVSTGVEGSSVTVANSGTTSAAVFDITIPKGDTGADSTVAGPAAATYSVSGTVLTITTPT